MVPLLDLWLPILLSSVAVFILSLVEPGGSEPSIPHPLAKLLEEVLDDHYLLTSRRGITDYQQTLVMGREIPVAHRVFVEGVV